MVRRHRHSSRRQWHPLLTVGTVVVLLLVAGALAMTRPIRAASSPRGSTVRGKVVDNDGGVEVSEGERAAFYLQDGPNYASAHALGLFTVTETGSPLNVASNATIGVNTVAGSARVYLLNVLDIYNASSMDSPVYVIINGTLPSGVTMYYGTTPASFNGTTSTIVDAAQWATGAHIQLPSLATPGADLYFAFALTGSASGSGSLTLQYVP